MKVAYLGFGALGQQIRQLLHENSIPICEEIFFDDNSCHSGLPGAHPFKSFLADEYAEFQFVVGLGYHHLPLKVSIINELQAANRKLLTFIHPSASVSPSTIIEDGVIIFPGCSICLNCHLEAGSVLCNACTLAHDVHLKKACFLGASVTSAGNVTIQEASFVGSGSTIANNLTIGRECRIGLATAVTHDLPDKVCAIGNPMRVLQTPFRLQ